MSARNIICASRRPKSRSWDQDLSDKFRFTLAGGFSKSDATIPVETTFVFDNRSASNYHYDYTNMSSPLLTFGTSVTDPANFQLAEIRDRPSQTVNKFRTGQLRAEWDVAEGFQVKLGGVYRRFEFDTKGYTRDAVVCPTKTKATPDAVLGTVTCTPSSVFGSSAIYGFPATGLSESFTLGNAGQPAGTTTDGSSPISPSRRPTPDSTAERSRSIRAISATSSNKSRAAISRPISRARFSVCATPPTPASAMRIPRSNRPASTMACP